MSLVLFDLDDTLLSADTERAWAEHMLTLSLDIEEGFLDKLDFVHVFARGQILKSGDASLAQELEKKGYDWVTNS